MVEIQDYQIPRLPESITDDSMIKESKRNVSSAVKGLIGAWNSLMEMPDLKWAIPEPKDVTLEWLDEEVERRCKGVKKLPNPFGEKQRLIDEWKQIAEKAKPYLQSVIDFFESYPAADVTVNARHELSVKPRNTLKCSARCAGLSRSSATSRMLITTGLSLSLTC